MDQNTNTSILTKIEPAETELSIAPAKDQQNDEPELFNQGKFTALQIYLKSIQK